MIRPAPLAILFAALVALVPTLTEARGEDPSRPNILWITSEDNGPQLGSYGDEYADTPHLDALARRGLRYRFAWSNAPVCAPARTAIISGLYPTATGGEHMRSMVPLPPGMRMYPQYLREAGYYATNNSKEDYNLEKPGKVWDESSGRAHYKNRAPGQPFFAIFNITVSHESQIRKRPHEAIHDPAKVRVPGYHPDTPEVRRDWAQYYDKVTEMDARAGEILGELDEAGLTEDTIIFYYGDHGPGMPRSKRWPYSSGLRVPLIVSIPEKYRALAPADYRAGGSSDRLVAFVDLAPTVLSLAGVRPPAELQGHAFLGPYKTARPDFVFGFRGRMDERIDLVRSVSDGRYVYIRNYMPWRPYGQYVSYMFETPTTRVWKKLYDEGKLDPPRTFFWERKPAEELYDLESDPDEVKNPASSKVEAHADALAKLRKAHRDQVFATRDIGFLPEEEIHTRAEGSTPYEVAHDPKKYPLEKIFAVAELASSGDVSATSIAGLREALRAEDSAVRYWAASGLLARGEAAVSAARRELRSALAEDSSPSVRIIAADALARYGGDDDVERGIDTLVELASLEKSSLYAAILALGALDELDGKALPWRERIAALAREKPGTPGRLSSYVPRLLEKTLADLEGLEVTGDGGK